MKEALLASCPSWIFSAGKFWALWSMGIQEGWIWSFLLLYNAVGSGCCTTQTAAQFGWAVGSLPASEQWPLSAQLQGRTTASCFHTSSQDKDTKISALKLHKMGCKRSKEEDEGGKRLALELSISPNSAWENKRTPFLFTPVALVEYDPCISLRDEVLSSGLGLGRLGWCLSPGSGMVCATSSLHGFTQSSIKTLPWWVSPRDCLMQCHTFFLKSPLCLNI